MSSLPDNYEQLIKDLHNRASKIRQPVNGTFELTERCNLMCRMCYICQSRDNMTKAEQELTAKQWVELAQQAVDNGMVFLLLTGGEVFLRPDFFDIYYPLTRMGLILTLFANGTLITNEIAARLSEAPPNRTEISIYGATEKTYEAVTRVPGSYKKCMNGIELLVKYNIPLALKTVLSRQNINELKSMRELAHSLGLPFSASWLLTKRHEGQNDLFNVEECRISPAECIDLEASDQAVATEWIETARRHSREYYESGIESDNPFYCHAGKSSFCINSKGEMSPCVDLALPAAKPLDAGFNTAWKEVQRFVDNAPPPAELCVNCDARIYCPLCPAWSQLETGTLTSPVKYLCEIAKARKVYFENHA